jgi:hypothetical protein
MVRICTRNNVAINECKPNRVVMCASGAMRLALSLAAGFQDGKASAAVMRDARGMRGWLVTTPSDDLGKERDLAAEEQPFNWP